MKLSIIVIGDEILIGNVVDTNTSEIARTFVPKGWTVQSVRIVGDSAQDISAAVAAALEEADLVITTGGLGPTRDDITKTVLMQCFGGSLIRNDEVLDNVKQIFSRRGLAMNALTESQAMVPSSCRVIQNTFGTAPVMWFEKDAKVLVAMPGVPFETRGMLPVVAENVNRHFPQAPLTPRREFTVVGITESDLAELLADFEDKLPSGFKLAYLPSPGYILLRLDGAPGYPNDQYDTICEQLKTQLSTHFVGHGRRTPAEIVLQKLRRHGYTIASAESCTGGNIAHSITRIAGCSDVYLGSVVSYANEVKSNVLGVPEETIIAHGAVSQEVVLSMAQNVARITGASCAVATSGIAGPGGGTPDKPVGTVWIAAHTPAQTIARLHHFVGDREAIIDRATASALNMLAELL